jgi:hypothetical protein
MVLSQKNPTEKLFQSYQNPSTQSVLKIAKNEISRPNWFLYEMKAKYPEPAVIQKIKELPNTGEDLKPGSTGYLGPMLRSPTLHVALIPI